LSVAIDNSDLTESDRREKREFIRKEIYLNSTASFLWKREREREKERGRDRESERRSKFIQQQILKFLSNIFGVCVSE